MGPNSDNGTIYFGYGSNLWKDQMIKRCPTSAYLGIARLTGYYWIINDRGYANVVEDQDNSTSSLKETWGLVYSLQHHDEEDLDVNEGVPFAYTKEILTVHFWPTQNGSPSNTANPPVSRKMLVYIDRKRVEPDKPKREYIYRMNMGATDALKEGVPKKYVDDVLRKFIPDVTDEAVAEFAGEQAVFFRDED